MFSFRLLILISLPFFLDAVTVCNVFPAYSARTRMIFMPVYRLLSLIRLAFTLRLTETCYLRYVTTFYPVSTRLPLFLFPFPETRVPRSLFPNFYILHLIRVANMFTWALRTVWRLLRSVPAPSRIYARARFRGTSCTRAIFLPLVGNDFVASHFLSCFLTT